MGVFNQDLSPELPHHREVEGFQASTFFVAKILWGELWGKSGLKTPPVSLWLPLAWVAPSLFIFVVFARFIALTAKFWQVDDHRRRQELTMNQSKTTLFRSRNLKGLVFLSHESLQR